MGHRPCETAIPTLRCPGLWIPVLSEVLAWGAEFLAQSNVNRRLFLVNPFEHKFPHSIMKLWAVFVVVLLRHVVLRHFVRAHFTLVRIGSIFHTAHNSRLERLPFF